MPLLDHFHSPLAEFFPWESIHSGWATRLADALGERLPAEFFATEHVHIGANLEIDVATFERHDDNRRVMSTGDSAVATLEPAIWAPPTAVQVMPAIFPDTFEVRVYSTTAGRT